MKKLFYVALDYEENLKASLHYDYNRDVRLGVKYYNDVAKLHH